MAVSRRSRFAGISVSGALLAATLVLAAVSASEGAAAAAEPCPGSGAEPCPYAQAQIIGQRAEGALRFPEAVAVEDTTSAAATQGSVYVADQLSYVVQKFSASGSFEAEWGSYGAGR